MSLTRDQRKRIIQVLEERPKMTKSELVEFVRPHYTPDYQRLVDQDLGRIANRLAASIKDENGDRRIFAGSYDEMVNIDTCKSFADVNKVVSNLIKARDSRERSIAKATRIKAELAGQQALF